MTSNSSLQRAEPTSLRDVSVEATGSQHQSRRRSACPLLIYLALTLLGALQAWSLADNGGNANGWLQCIALGGFFVILDRTVAWKQAAVQSWWLATSWLVGVFWWIYIALHSYGGLPIPVSITAFALLAMALGAYYAFAATIYFFVRSDNATGNALKFAACWTLAELARGQWLTGFPWGAIGYAHVDSSLAWLARWIGVYGIGSVAALLSALWSTAAIRLCNREQFIAGVGPLLVAGTLTIGIHYGGLWQERQLLLNDSLSRSPMALFQGNIGVAQKFDPEGVRTALSWYGAQLLQRSEQLVIAPETAIPALEQDLPPGYLEQVTAPYQHGDRALLLGVPLGDGSVGYHNAVQGYQAKATFTYYK